MKILHVNLAKGWRGGEQQTLRLMQALRDLGMNASLVARAGEPLATRAREDGFSVHGVRWALGSVGHRGRKVDLVHAHETRALQAAALSRCWHRRPLVVTRRVDFMPSGHFFTRWKYAQADRVVCISQAINRIMGDFGIPQERRCVIPSSAGTPTRADAHLDAQTQAIRERLQGLRVVGCIAALVTAHKGQDVLLQAMHLLQRDLPDTALVLVGDGADRAALEQQASALGLRHVFFEGFQQRPQAYWPVLDVLALPSRTEGLGSILLDSFAHRVPVVATQAGGIPEVVEHEKTGLLVPPAQPQPLADALGRMLTDTPLADRLRQQAFQAYEARWTMQAMAASYQQVYETLLHASDSRHIG